MLAVRWRFWTACQSGKAYTMDVAASGGKVMVDHGALRTVRWFGLGELPPVKPPLPVFLNRSVSVLNSVFPEIV